MSAPDHARSEALCMAAAEAISRLDIDQASRMLVADALADAFASDAHPLLFRLFAAFPQRPPRDPASIRTLRRTLLHLRDSYDPPDENVLEQEALTRVIDAWDEYEYAAGTAEGCQHEVIS